MTTISLGKVKFSWRGNYSNTATYNEQDIAAFNGTTYICTQDSTSNVVPATVSTNLGTATEEYYAKVQADGGSNYFYIDVTDGSGTYVKQKYLKLIEGNTYKFYQNDSSNANHPLLFSATSDGTHTTSPSAGTNYSSGVSYYLDGAAAQDKNVVGTFTLTSGGYDAGRTANINSNVATTSSGSGTGFVCDVQIDGSGNATIVKKDSGTGYAVNDTITIAASSIVGTGTTDIVLTVNSLGDGLAAYTSSAYTNATTRYVQIQVPVDAPNLYYYCHYHSGMGGSLPTAKASVSVTVNSSNWATFATGVDSTGSVEGDLLYYDGTNLVPLPVGAENQVLKIDESTLMPVWEQESVRSGTKVAKSKVDMAGSYRSQMVLMQDGSLRWWGNNGNYKGGIGYTTNNRSQPIPVAFPQEFPGIDTQVEGNFMQNYNSYGACIDKNNHLWTWGNNNYGEMGIQNNTGGGTFEGRRGVPVNISTRTNYTGGIGSTSVPSSRKKIVELATPHATDGNNGAIVVRDEDGFVYGSGYNGHGVMGQGNTSAQYQFKQYPTFGVGGVSAYKAKQIKISSASNPTLIVLTENGDVYSVGYSGYYQHGENNTTNHTTPTIVPVVGPTNGGNVIDRIAAVSHKGVFVIDTANNLWNWGYDNNGYFGRGGTAGNYYNPTNVMSDVSKVAVTHPTDNYNSTMVIKTDGSVWAAGYNGYGQLGQGNTTALNTYTEMKFRLLQNDGTYANQTLSAANYPFTITQAMFAGGSQYQTSAVLTSEGKVWTCGYNGNGQVGVGQTGNNYYVFYEVYGLPGKVIQISNHGQSSEGGWAALLEDGQLFMWGYGGSYAIPEDDAHSFYTPKLVLF